MQLDVAIKHLNDLLLFLQEYIDCQALNQY